MSAEADSSSGVVMEHRRQGPRRRTMALLSAAAVVTLAACGGGSGTPSASSSSPGGAAQKGGTLNMLGSGDVDSIDPNLTYYTIGYQAARLFSRTPYAYPAEKGKTTVGMPDLATADPAMSADGLTATWHIREGVKWNTTPARQVTAEDAIRGLKRSCNPVLPFGGQPDFSELFVGYQAFCDGFLKVDKNSAQAVADYQEKTPISGVKVGSDDRTVVMTLSHTAAYLKDMMTLPAFAAAPKEFNAYLPGSAELGQHTLSDGPYQVTAYTPTKKLEFGRNAAWDAATDPIRKAYVDKIVIDMTVTQESAQQQLQTGTPSADMEFDNFPPVSQLPALLKSNDPNFNLGPTASSNPYLLYNLRSPNNNGALQKLDVRKALSYGLNRATIIQAMGGPKVNPPLAQVLPPAILGGETSFDPYPHDVDKAKQLLAGAGVTNLTLKVLYRPKSSASVKAFETIQQDLKPLGITVTGVGVPGADFLTKYLQKPDVAERGVWDVAIAGWGADWYGNAAISFFKPLFYGKPAFPPAGSNFGFYDSATANAAIDKAAAAKTEAEAKTLWAAADQAVMADAPFFPLTSSNQPNYHASQVHNAIYVEAIQNFDPANVWLDPAKNG